MMRLLCDLEKSMCFISLEVVEVDSKIIGRIIFYIDIDKILFF